MLIALGAFFLLTVLIAESESIGNLIPSGKRQLHEKVCIHETVVFQIGRVDFTQHLLRTQERAWIIGRTRVLVPILQCTTALKQTCLENLTRSVINLQMSKQLQRLRQEDPVSNKVFRRTIGKPQQIASFFFSKALPHTNNNLCVFFSFLIRKNTSNVRKLPVGLTLQERSLYYFQQTVLLPKWAK